MLDAVAARARRRAGRPTLHRLEGDARQLVGDWDGALVCYERAAADGSGPLDPGLAWRWGLIHHLRGDLDTALDIYARGGRRPVLGRRPATPTR